MKGNFLSRTLYAATVASLMGMSYVAGTAQSTQAETITKLNSAVDFLVKAQALLNAAGSNRMGYANVEKAKADVADAINETAKAVKANGG